MTDAEFRAKVMECLKYPGKAFEIDGVSLRVYPTYEVAIIIPEYFDGGNMIHVALHSGKSVAPNHVFGVSPNFETGDTRASLQVLCEMIGYRFARDTGYSPSVAIFDTVRGNWLNADGTLCKVQDAGPQRRAIELDVRIGSFRV